MRDRNQDTGKMEGKGRRSYRVVLIPLLVLALALGYAYFRVAAMNRGVTGIVEKPPEAGPVTPTPGEELEIIEGTPDDIDLDYVVDVIDPSDVPIYKQARIDADVINILLIGSDVRPGESGNGRSDSMILLSYDKAKEEARLVSFMRDVWISIPDIGWNRINAAYSYGGVGLSVNTVNENFNLDIQEYILVDFEGFKNIIDEVGGIEVNLTKVEAKYINNGSAEAKVEVKDGIQKLNGTQALIHSRNRKTGDGDFGRTRRQREVMLALFTQVRGDLQPLKLPALLNQVLSYARTNMKPDTMMSLGLNVLSAKDLGMVNARIPFDNTWKYAMKEKRSVVTIDLEENVERLHDLIYGED
ncbi:MAG TPA: LCP family protein [Clostridiaceae bacterium]|nr:LCP family protein [Clostridiaceae bacterium]